MTFSWTQVESGRIDHGLHANRPLKSMAEAVSLDQAVSAALKVCDFVKLDNYIFATSC